MGKDIETVATLEKELKRTREMFSKSRPEKEIERDTVLIKSVPMIPHRVDTHWRAMNVNQESVQVDEKWVQAQSPTSLQMT